MQETPRHSPRHTGCWQCLPPEEQQRICCNCDHAARAEDCVTHQGKHMAIQGILYSAPAAKKNQESQLEPTRGRLKPSRAAQLGALTAGVKPVSRVWDAGGEHGDGCASREQEWSNMWMWLGKVSSFLHGTQAGNDSWGFVLRHTEEEGEGELRRMCTPKSQWLIFMWIWCEAEPQRVLVCWFQERI